MNFIGNNQENFHIKSAVQNINARNKYNIHRATVMLSEEGVLFWHQNFEQFTMFIQKCYEWRGSI
jgi:hypothetical protein